MAPRTSFSADLVCLIGQLGNGGTERQLYLFLKHLDRTRVRPLVVVSAAPGGLWQGRFEQELGVPIVFLGGIPAPLKLWRFRRLVRQARPRIVFSWSFFTNPYRLAASGTRFVGSLRQQLAVQRRQLPGWWLRAALTGPHLVVNSTRVAAELREAGVAGNRVCLIPNIYEPMPRPLADRAALRRELNLPADAIVVAGIGRDSPTKDWPLFLAACAAARQSCPKLHALLIGSGGTALQPAIRARGMESACTITGEVPDARRLLPAADLFFLSSREEGMPNVLLEAADAGCAILATDVGGVRDILAEAPDEAPTAGIIIAPGDINGAAEALARLAGDETLRLALAVRARARLAAFTADTAMAKYLEILQLDRPE